MTLAQQWTIIVKRYKFILTCMLLIGLGALGASRLMTPQYQATVLVQIAIPSTGSNTTDYNSLLASDQLVQTEATLATSDAILRAVVAHYPGLTPEQLAREVTATPKLNTQLFEIDVLDASPTRAAKLANDIANSLIAQQVQMMQQQKAESGNFFLIAQPAQPATSPVRPNIPLNTAAGLLVGLLLGVLLAVLFEQVDTRIRTPEAVNQLLGWPILATIWKADPEEGIIDPKKSTGNVESYRILRTNIGFSSVNKPLRSLVVTSSSPQDGKSVVAANLAIYMARAGKKTLLIDADLRRPSVHALFNLPPDKKGLSNAILECSFPAMVDTPPYQKAMLPETTQPSLLTVTKTAKRGQQAPGAEPSPSHGSIALDYFIHPVPVPNLCVMPSGPLPPNSSELLDSKAMQRFFSALDSCGVEVVIFDTPPLLGLSDASVLASKVDGTLVVVDVTRAKKGSLKQVQMVLGQAGAHVLGCIVNKQARDPRNPIYAYYMRESEPDALEQRAMQGDAINVAPTKVYGAPPPAAVAYGAPPPVVSNGMGPYAGRAPNVQAWMPKENAQNRYYPWNA